MDKNYAALKIEAVEISGKGDNVSLTSAGYAIMRTEYRKVCIEQYGAPLNYWAEQIRFSQKN